MNSEVRILIQMGRKYSAPRQEQDRAHKAGNVKTIGLT